MSTSVSILGAAVVFAAAQLLLRKDSPSYAFLLSIGAAVFILLRLGAAAQDLMRGVWALSRRVDGTAFSCLLRCAGILLITDYARTLCEEAGADLIEGNFSCPQMTSHAMGSDVGQNPELVKHYCEVVTAATHLPVIAKMTPNIGNMEIPAIASMEGGAAGIAAINTVKAITNIDIENITAMPVVNGKSSISGYSGAAVKPIALRFITQMKQHPDLVNVPITGVGGIETWRDALEFILVGASNLQVTTAVMQYGYRIVEDMISGLSHYMEDNGIEKLSDLVGLALPNIVPAEDLDRSFKLLPKFDEDACAGCGRCYVSCFDGGHQAIDWDEEARRPRLNTDKCVGCHLCLNVCPVMDCITPGEIVIKPGREEHEIKIKTKYE